MFSAKDKKNQLIWVCVVICYLLITAIVFINHSYWGDERHFVETIKLFGSSPFLEIVKNYPEVTTPLTFIFYSGWGSIFGFSLFSLRLFSLAISFTALIFLFGVVNQYLKDSNISLKICIGLIINPYMIGLSIFVFTDMLAFLFILLTVYFFNKGKNILVAVFVSGALLCRQYSVFVLIAISLLLLIMHLKNKDYRKLLKIYSVFVIALIPLFVLMYFWKGFAPPDGIAKWTNGQTMSWNTSSFITYITFSSVYLLPVILITKLYFLKNRFIIVSGLILGLCYFFFGIQPSKVTIIQGTYDTVGLAHRFIKYLSAGTIADNLILYMATVIGIIFLVNFIKDDISNFADKKYNIYDLPQLIIYSFLIIMPLSYQVWEKYLLPVLPFYAIILVKKFAKINKDKIIADEDVLVE